MSFQSNGMISVGFLVYCAVKKAMKAHVKCKKFADNANYKTLHASSTLQAPIISNIILLIINILSCLLPFIVFQRFIFNKFCFTNSSDTPSWCKENIGLSYSTVQARYWNVGTWQYWEALNLPAFLMGIPTLSKH